MNDYLFDLSFKDVEDQKDVAEGDSYNGLSNVRYKVVKTFDLNGNSLRVSVFANNLLDEVARNHSSFVKNRFLFLEGIMELGLTFLIYKH